MNGFFSDQTSAGTLTQTGLQNLPNTLSLPESRFVYQNRITNQPEPSKNSELRTHEPVFNPTLDQILQYTSHLRSQWQISKELFLWEKLDENTPQGGWWDNNYGPP